MDIQQIRAQFPILHREVNGKKLVYLDNGASSQKPLAVLNCLRFYYENTNANVHRGIHTLSQIATQEMEVARGKIQRFIHAKKAEEIIFTKGTTESLNLVAYAMTSQIKAGDEIVISYLEHHSNIVPWQMLCERTGAQLRVIPMTKEGVLEISALDEILNERTKIVAFNHVSNALGVVNPVTTMVQKIRAKTEAYIVLDAAQSIQHFHIDVQALDVDFLAFSGHKMYAPTGTGILYGKFEIMRELPPFHGGGEMIQTCSFQQTTYACLPFRFEAGTPNIAGNIALGAAVDFIQKIGQNNIQAHEQSLLTYAQKQLSAMEEIKIYAEKAEKAGAISFNLSNQGISSDVGMILDKMGIAVRTGHHCAQPLMAFLDIAGTVRASFAVYNTIEEIDLLVEGIQKSIKMLR